MTLAKLTRSRLRAQLLALACVASTTARPAEADDALANAPAQASLGAALPVEPYIQSTLPVPEAPPEPARRRRFDIPADDPASAAAREIARRVSQFKNFRAEIPGAVWRVDEAARFSIRSEERCLAALAQRNVHAQPLTRELATPVPSPVVLEGPIEGVSFYSLHVDRALEVSCELALRLPAIARVLRKLGVLAVGVNSSYRDQPKVSFHSFGLALDMASFHTRGGTLHVIEHFELTPEARTCEATPATSQGRALLAIACALADSNLVSSVLTPNYNEGHRDHFHIDLRPDDARLFVR